MSCIKTCDSPYVPQNTLVNLISLQDCERISSWDEETCVRAEIWKGWEDEHGIVVKAQRSKNWFQFSNGNPIQRMWHRIHRQIRVQWDYIFLPGETTRVYVGVLAIDYLRYATWRKIVGWIATLNLGFPDSDPISIVYDFKKEETSIAKGRIA